MGDFDDEFGRSLFRDEATGDAAWGDFARQMRQAPMPELTDAAIADVIARGRRERLRRIVFLSVAAVLAIALGVATIVTLDAWQRDRQAVPGPNPLASASATASPTSEPSPVQSTSPTAASTATPSPSAATGTLTPPTGTLVNAADYLDESMGAGHYYAVAPSGNIACGIFTDALGGIQAGCQANYPAAQVDCGANPDFAQPLATWDAAGALSVTCTSEGIFRPSTAARPLPYGSSLTVGDYTMTSTEQGVWMVRSDGTGFRVNRGEGIVSFR